MRDAMPDEFTQTRTQNWQGFLILLCVCAPACFGAGFWIAYTTNSRSAAKEAPRQNDKFYEPMHSSSNKPTRSAAKTEAAGTGGPDATEKIDYYGASVNGDRLAAHVLGAGSNTTLIVGGFHGDERSAVLLVDQFARYLTSNPKLLNGSTVVLVPRANPDGCKAGTRVNAHDVDIELDFDTEREPDGIAARDSPLPQAVLEPEARAIVALIRKYHPAKIVSIHQPGFRLRWNGEGGRALAKEMEKHNMYSARKDIRGSSPGSFAEYCDRALGIGLVNLELPQDIGPRAALNDNKTALTAAIRFAPQSTSNTLENEKQE